MKKIVLLQPAYPYGKSQVYMGGALISVGSQLLALGFEVTMFDLNMTDIQTIMSVLQNADYVGVTVIGSPYIPGTIEIAKQLAMLDIPVLIGGQVIAKLGQREFITLFAGTNAVQIKNQVDLAEMLAVDPASIPDAFSISLIPMWERMGDEMLHKYLKNEMTLVFSQGCHFQCAFCAAEKKQRERFKGSEHLCHDLEYLVGKAKEFGLKKLEFYTTSLDFFQNVAEVQERLQIIASVQETSGIQIKIRCLSCMVSFMKASKEIQDFEVLLRQAGLWCVGFGIDGLDSLVWLSQKKRQNKTLEQVWTCLDYAEKIGVQAEALLVMGFPEERIRMMFKYLQFAFVAGWKHKRIVLRPYLAKPQIPGNDHWGADDPDREFVRLPQKFKSLDFCAIGSPDTNPIWWHRWSANLVFLLICGIWSPLGKCTTSPLMPQGRSRLWNAFADLWNRIVPFDR
ncbi:MAG: radical SAM protein [Patescibacteria group bacterium]